MDLIRKSFFKSANYLNLTCFSLQIKFFSDKVEKFQVSRTFLKKNQRGINFEKRIISEISFIQINGQVAFLWYISVDLKKF